MSRGTILAYSGARAQITNLDAQANNLANASTIGFKGVRPHFKQMVSDAESRQNEGASSRGLPVMVAEFVPDMAQGPIQQTGEALDIALDGKGWLVVQTPDGERYTRAGNLRISDSGFLTNVTGKPLMGTGGLLRWNDSAKGDVVISETGEIRVGEQRIGKLLMVEFNDTTKMQADGGILWRASEEAGRKVATETRVMQGQLEKSNVNVVKAMGGVVKASRAFEVFQKAISMFRDIDRKAASEILRRR